MSFTTLVKTLAVAALVKPSIAGYALEDDYSTQNFFSMFEFFTAPDPTDGFVQFVDQSTAQSAGLISTSGGSVRMGVDHTNIAPDGRNSVRLTSNKVYNQGLIVLDIAHMPEGCGTWPAFWTTGPDWPNNGEIDIIEGVNDQSFNAMTLHTGPSCSISNNAKFSGKLVTNNCDVNAPDQYKNTGCSIGADGQHNTYGAGLNSINGGVYAMEWTSSGISTFFFPRSSIPADITKGKPNPSNWGTPLSTFNGGCDFGNSIKNQQIVFDTTFCGQWAGNTWSSSTCAAKANTCNEYVANNPAAFANAYWDIKSLKVYQDNGAGDSATSTNAGPTGIESTLPAAVSSLAPIPETSGPPGAFATTFATSYKGASVIPLSSIGGWGNALAAVTTAPITAAVAAPTPSVLTQIIHADGHPDWAPWTQLVTVAAPAAATPTAEAAEAAWFAPGNEGIPESEVGGARMRRRHLMRHAGKRGGRL